VADKSFENAEYAVMVTALPLVGIMTLWLGIMRLAERAGLVALLARALRPLMVWLFPDVPADHPATGSMRLNMAASAPAIPDPTRAGEVWAREDARPPRVMFSFGISLRRHFLRAFTAIYEK
jgi:hypothetical protein